MSVEIVPYEREVHADGPFHVVTEVWKEYGWKTDLEHDNDIVDPGSYYRAQGGGFAVALEDGRVVGCVGISEEGRSVFKLNRLYVLAEARKSGTGRRLVDWVLHEARKREGRKVILFSDIAFLDAHQLYEKCGFRRISFRYAPDFYESREWGFELDLTKGER